MTAPTPADRIEQLSPAKRALFERLRGATASVHALGAAAIPKRSALLPTPLSFAQQRLWILDQLEPQNPFYNVAVAMRLTGPLQPAALERAIQAVIQRHEVLRSTFRGVDGRPEQIVANHLVWSLQCVDLAAQLPHERESAWRRMAEQESLTPFDLQRGPLIRGTLIALAPAEHVLLLTLHHIVCDGWSMKILQRETAENYAALAAGRALEVEPLEIQYADYAAWQQTASLVRPQSLDYWLKRLTGFRGVLDLPLDHPRPAAQTFRGAAVRRRLDATRLDALRRVAREENASLFMLLLTAYFTLLARYSGARDLCVGTPVANRTHAQLEELIGFFVNTLPIRVNLSGQPTLRDLLAQVRSLTLDAYAHQELSFEKLIDHLNLPRDPSRTPVFQSLFVLQDNAASGQHVADLTVSEITFDHAPISNYDLTLNADQQDDRLLLSLVYNPDLFEDATIEQMLDSYLMLLEAFCGDLDCSALEAPLLPAATRLSLDRWNSTRQTFRDDACLHQLFGEQARRSPQALAVVSDEACVTYEQLDKLSDRLASRLLERGIVPESPIGFCLPRSPELIVALLGILKAGAAYVPLDASYPAARLAHMIGDSGLSLIVTCAEFASRLPLGNVTALFLDELTVAHAGPARATPISQPRQLAYILYTSGSTGDPKGVAVEHRGLVNHALQIATRLNIGRDDRMLQYLSPSFDAAAEEIFPTLLSGATLRMHAAPAELSGKTLLDWSREQRVNLLHLTPPIWLSLVDELELSGAEVGRHLKAVVAGGDSIHRPDVARWRRATGGKIPLIFAYGVTEASITTTLFDAQDDAWPSSTGLLPIGRPLANTRAYVLDEFRQPTPIGVAGEIYIAGVGVARGYWRQDELTAERFMDDTFGAAGERMYRTGDLGRWLHDGTLEFLGRRDQQIKWRGYRIEPGEIEAALRRQLPIRDVVVVAALDASGEKQLIAYLETDDGAALESQWRSALAQQLPRHVLPTTIVAVDHLARLPNGKIDRQRLPAARQRRLPKRDIDGEPHTDIERALTQIWSQVLGLPMVGVHDNFFELGGDSIRGIQMISRAGALGLRFTPKQLFQFQTIAELASQGTHVDTAHARQGPITGPMPLTPIQHEFFALGLIEPGRFNQAVLLIVPPYATPDVLDRAAQKLLAHHDALRVRFEQTDQDEWRPNGIPIDDRPLLEMINLASVADSMIDAAIEQASADIHAGLNLSVGPLIRFVRFDLGPARPSRLLIVAHHLVIDAVSWRILLDDLQNLCRQLSQGAAPQLPAKTTALADWADALTAFANSAPIQAEFDFWIQQASDARIPRDLTQGGNHVAREACATAALSPDETAQWLYDSQTAYRTRPQELLIAALAATLCDYANADSVGIDLEGHGRDAGLGDVDLSRTVGWLTALYPVRLDRPRDRTDASWIKSIKESLRAVPHGGVGYGLLRWLTDAPTTRARLAALPGREVSFNYLGQFDAEVATSDFVIIEPDMAVHRAPREARAHFWEIVAYVRGKQLHIVWRYASDVHHAATIECLLTRLMDRLRSMIAHGASSQVGSATPSDFPLAGADQDDLDQLARLLEAADNSAPASDAP